MGVVPRVTGLPRLEVSTQVLPERASEWLRGQLDDPAHHSRALPAVAPLNTASFVSTSARPWNGGPALPAAFARLAQRVPFARSCWVVLAPSSPLARLVRGLVVLLAWWLAGAAPVVWKLFWRELLPPRNRSPPGTARLRRRVHLDHALVIPELLAAPSSFQNFLRPHRHSRTSSGGMVIPDLLPAPSSFRNFLRRHRHSRTSCGGMVIPELLAAPSSFQNVLLRRRHSRTSCCAVVIPELLAAPSSVQNVVRRRRHSRTSCGGMVIPELLVAASSKSGARSARSARFPREKFPTTAAPRYAAWILRSSPPPLRSSSAPLRNAGLRTKCCNRRCACDEARHRMHRIPQAGGHGAGDGGLRTRPGSCSRCLETALAGAAPCLADRGTSRPVGAGVRRLHRTHSMSCTGALPSPSVSR